MRHRRRHRQTTQQNEIDDDDGNLAGKQKKTRKDESGCIGKHSLLLDGQQQQRWPGPNRRGPGRRLLAWFWLFDGLGGHKTDDPEQEPSTESLHLHDLGRNCRQRRHFDPGLLLVPWRGGRKVSSTALEIIARSQNGIENAKIPPPPSVPSLFFILFFWVFEIQLLMQIIVNRIAIISETQTTINRLKWGTALVISAINIAVFCIFIPAHLNPPVSQT